MIEIINNSKNLLKSMIVKFEVVADFMNKQISTYERVNIDPNPRTWIYYQNIAGIYHEQNTPIRVISLDTNEEITLTRDALIIHVRTREKLLEFGEFFNQTNIENEYQETLLRGVLSNITLDEIIDAPDLTVVGYDKDLLSYRETNILVKINERLTAFMERWYYPEFGSSNRYVPTIMSQALSVAFLTLVTSRIENLNTENASDLDIEYFFKSNKNVADIIPYISDDVKIWLYANLKTHIRDSGLDTTMLSLYDNVLKPSGYRLYRLRYLETGISFNLDTLNLTETPWSRTISVGKYALSGDGVLEDVIPEDTYLKMQEDYTVKEYEVPKSEFDLVRKKTSGITGGFETKSLLLTKTLELNKISKKEKIETALSIWIKGVLNGNDTRSLSVQNNIDPTLVISSRDALILSIYLLTDKTNETITSFSLNETIKNSILDDLKLLPTKKRDINPKAMIEPIIPTISTIFYNEVVLEYISETIKFKEYINTLESSINEVGNVENIKRIKNFIFGNTNIVVPEPIVLLDELLKSDISTEFLSETDVLNNIVESFTGISEIVSDDGNNTLDIFKGFIKKFLSYNVQILLDNNSSNIDERGIGCSINKGINLFKILEILPKPLGDMISPINLSIIPEAFPIGVGVENRTIIDKFAQMVEFCQSELIVLKTSSHKITNTILEVERIKSISEIGLISHRINKISNGTLVTTPLIPSILETTLSVENEIQLYKPAHITTNYSGNVFRWDSDILPESTISTIIENDALIKTHADTSFTLLPHEDIFINNEMNKIERIGNNITIIEEYDKVKNSYSTHRVGTALNDMNRIRHLGSLGIPELLNDGLKILPNRFMASDSMDYPILNVPGIEVEINLSAIERYKSGHTIVPNYSTGTLNDGPTLSGVTLHQLNDDVVPLPEELSTIDELVDGDIDAMLELGQVYLSNSQHSFDQLV